MPFMISIYLLPDWGMNLLFLRMSLMRYSRMV